MLEDSKNIIKSRHFLQKPYPYINIVFERLILKELSKFRDGLMEKKVML